jgi:hypothetical protein
VTLIPGVIASASKGEVTTPDPPARPSQQTPTRIPTSAPVMVEPIDPFEAPPAATQATRPPDDASQLPAPVEFQLLPSSAVMPRSGLGRLVNWTREHKGTVLGVGGALLALCLVLLIVLPRLRSDNEPDGRRNDDDNSQVSDEARGPVFGTVKYDGKTVSVGTISFHPEKGTGVSVEIQNGKYRVDTVPPGPVLVTVSTVQIRQVYKAVERQRKSGQPPPGTAPVSGGGQPLHPQDKLKDKRLPEMPGANDLAGKQDEAWNNIKDMIDVPAKFEDPKTSGLDSTIRSGSQEINIDLPKVESFKPKKT